jgi:hypothetical protein
MWNLLVNFFCPNAIRPNKAQQLHNADVALLDPSGHGVRPAVPALGVPLLREHPCNDAFHDKGAGTTHGEGFKKIRVHLVHAVKHNG